MYTDKTEEELVAMYKDFYKDAGSHSFEHVCAFKASESTSHCFIKVEKHDDKVFITSVIDNLEGSFWSSDQT